MHFRVWQQRKKGLPLIEQVSRAWQGSGYKVTPFGNVNLKLDGIRQADHCMRSVAASQLIGRRRFFLLFATSAVDFS